MSISPGRTAEEIREFVHEYQLGPHGRKGAWLAVRGLTYDSVRRWEGGPMTFPEPERTALEKARAAERAAQESEVAKLTARVRELEETNAALGKAIGLLHAMNEPEPETGPTKTDPDDS